MGYSTPVVVTVRRLDRSGFGAILDGAGVSTAVAWGASCSFGAVGLSALVAAAVLGAGVLEIG